jgi:hypothetical protein
MPLLNTRVRAMLRPAHWQLIGVLPLRLRRHYYHLAITGKPGHFRRPQTFNDKVNWRIIHDRRDRVAAACDKMRMKELARAAYPGTHLRIPETYWFGTDLRAAPLLAGLPPWVLKPNNSSGRVLFGPDPHTDVALLLEQMRDWSKRTSLDLGEWGYSQARPVLLLEERIPTQDGTPPSDYKFFVFDGRVELVQVNRNRFGASHTATFLDAEWRRLPVRWLTVPSGDEPRPAELETMLEIARSLGSGWDFVRVDLYAVDGAVWFGEYTPYPGTGVLRYLPPEFDAEMGRHWRLPAPRQVRSGQP